MKCHYEILEVSRDAELAEIKSAYRKFALKWHPDKNLDNTEHAKEQFQLVQQAYEVLSDPQERAWYDKHREQILRGSNSEFEDNSLDVFQYFTATCFKGYGDDDKGFYTVYRNVFDQIIEEDLEFMDDKDELSDVPRFGDSQSDYDEVVGPFYAYWSSYCTKKSYVWLDPYDIKEIRDRRVFKAAEKENKKVRMKAKKERNEEVRNLVAFVRKRDKRVQENAKRLEAKILENRQKQEELSKQRRMERKKQLNESGAQAEWTKFDNVKSELEEIEKNLAQEFGEELSNSEEEFEENSDLYCVACNKIFKTVKALENHESSKKHRENVEKLKASMIEEEEDLAQEFDEERSNFEEESEESSGLYCMTCNKIFKTVKALENHESSKKHKENVEKLKAIMIEEEEEDLAQEFDEERANSEEESEESSVLYCMTCNKIFKTVKALENHESSKKHRENVEKLKPSMIEEEEGSEIVDDEYLSEEESENSRDRTEKQNRKNENNHAVTGDVVDLSDEESEESIEQIKKRKKKNKKAKNVLPLHRDEEEEVDVIKIVNSDEDFNFECTKKQKKRNKRQNKNMNTTQEETENVERDTKTNKNKKQQKKEKKDVTIEEIDTSHCCVTCKSNFPSKNKLFDHLKKTGHGVHIPKKSKNVK